jgi:hypothetical protein
MASMFLKLAVFAGFCHAQFKPTLQTIEDIADANIAEAKDFLAASRNAPSISSMERAIAGASTAEQSALGVNQGNAGGLSSATAFLARRQFPSDGVVRPLVQRSAGPGVEFGSVGEFERKTQAPLVWLRLHATKMGAPTRLGSYEEFARQGVAQLN